MVKNSVSFRGFSKKVLLIISSLTVGCSSPVRTVAPENQPVVKDYAHETSDGPAPFILFEKDLGECSSCSAYAVSVFSDGKFVFEGKANVKKLGVSVDLLPKQQLDELLSKFEVSDFTKLADRYVRGENCSMTILSDSPTVKILYRKADISKSVFHYTGCESTVGNLGKLILLEKSIEDIIRDRRWIE